jgi:iron only hydrogenase large subunit-like protein
LTIADKAEIAGNFVEGMVCKGGCIGGPCGLIPVAKARQAVERSVAETKQTAIKQTMEMPID